MIIISNIINRTKNINTEWFVFVAELQENWAGKKEPIRKALEVKKGNSSIGKKKIKLILTVLSSLTEDYFQR